MKENVIIKKTKGGFLISGIKQVQDRLFYGMLKKSGIDISSGQGRILYVLWQESPMNISEIGKRASLAKTTLTAMLDRMEDKGIVNRCFDKTNRRQINIHLTDSALSMKNKFQSLSDEMTEIFYEGFSDSEIDAFENQLEKILKNLNEKEKNLK